MIPLGASLIRCEKMADNTINQDLCFSTFPYAFNFFLNTYFLPIVFLPTSNSTRSQALFLSKVVISSTLDFFQSLQSYESTSSLIDLGSSSITNKIKFKLESGGVYLSGCLFSQTTLLKIRVCGSYSSDSLFFNLNSILSSYFSLNMTYYLITSFTSLNTTSRLYKTFLIFWFQIL